MTTTAAIAASAMAERWNAICDRGFALGGIRILSHNLGRRKGEAADSWDCGFINRLYLDGMTGL